MRMTLASLGALTLTALLFTACDKDQVGGTNPPEDLSMTQPDLSGDVADMAVGTPDLATPADLAITPVTPTEFTVVRIGTGTAALTNDATATFLERRKIADILKAAAESGVKHYFIEDESPTSMDQIPASLKFLRANGFE